MRLRPILFVVTLGLVVVTFRLLGSAAVNVGFFELDEAIDEPKEPEQRCEGRVPVLSAELGTFPEGSHLT